ncbi:MAG: PAS domain S-box protein [Chitinophagaceae bacterium]
MVFSAQKLFLLVVEDNPGDYLLIEEALREEIEDPVIHHAPTLKLAREFLQQNPAYDVVLLDLSLPDGAGETLVQEVINMAGPVPVIVLTGYTDRGFGIRSLALGVSDYLLKEELSGFQLYKSIAFTIERRRVHLQIKKSEEKYRQLFELNPVPMWIFDVETLQLLSVNEAAIQHYGYSREEFLSLTTKDLRPKENIQAFVQSIRDLARVEGFRTGIYTHQTRSGEIIQVEIVSNWIDFEGRKARLVLATDITERQKIEEAVKFSEKRFKSLVQDGSDWIAILDRMGNYIYVSPTSLPILEIDAQELTGKNAFDYIFWEDLSRVREDFDRVLTQTKVEIAPFRVLNGVGKWIWMETIVTNMLDDPAINGIIANTRDVSLRILYEDKIKKQEALFRAIIEKSPEIKTLINPDGRIIFGTPSLTEILGYPPEEFLGMDLPELLHPDDQKIFRDKINDLLDSSVPFDQFQVRIKSKTGKYHWCNKTLTNLMSDPDVGAIVCNFWDITDQKENELKLRESNDRYNMVAKATSDTIRDWDLESGQMGWNKGIMGIFGYGPPEEKTDQDWWWERIHPDDSDRIREQYQLRIHQKIPKWQEEYQFRCADGTYKYIFDRCFLLISKEGNPLRILGAMQDISRRKAEEHRLKLLESVITNASDVVMITEAEPIDEPGPKIVYVNDAFTRVTGYSREEVLGRSPRLLQGPGTDRSELDRMKLSMTKWETFEVELLNYKKNGEEFWINMAIAPLADSKGWFTHWISIERDITERMNHLKAIEDQNKKLKEIAWIQSHVVRSPLTRMMGLIDLLTHHIQDKNTQDDLIRHILTSAHELDNIIRDIVNKSENLNQPK